MFFFFLNTGVNSQEEMYLYLLCHQRSQYCFSDSKTNAFFPPERHFFLIFIIQTSYLIFFYQSSLKKIEDHVLVFFLIKFYLFFTTFYSLLCRPFHFYLHPIISCCSLLVLLLQRQSKFQNPIFLLLVGSGSYSARLNMTQG